MAAKTHLAFQLLGALLLGAIFFASWTATMYLPHGTRGSHIANSVFGACLLYAAWDSFRRRRLRAKTARLKGD